MSSATVSSAGFVVTDTGETAARPVVLLDGQRVGCAQVRDVARGLATAAMSDEGVERARAAATMAAEVAATREVYGRTTGVGANRDQPVGAADGAEHGYRLLRSHAGGGGPLIAAELSRAMLVVRANQIAAGGSGVDPGVLGPLLAGGNAGLSVPVPRYGAIGTGDLTALAAAALCLLGERDWLLPPGSEPVEQPRYPLASADALAFLSSNAATIGEAALACCDLADLLMAATVIAALSHCAVDGSLEPYAADVHEARRYRGQRAVDAVLRTCSAPTTAIHGGSRTRTGTARFRRCTAHAVDAVRRARRGVRGTERCRRESAGRRRQRDRSGTTATSTPPTSAWRSTPSELPCSRRRAVGGATRDARQ
jgi:histidine ammonia-lyase